MIERRIAETEKRFVREYEVIQITETEMKRE
jgi:hypothetical protein